MAKGTCRCDWVKDLAFSGWALNVITGFLYQGAKKVKGGSRSDNRSKRLE